MTRSARAVRLVAWASVVGLWLLVSVAVGGATPSGTQDAPPTAGAPEPEYTLGPADLISIKVFGVPQLDQTTRLSNSGKIRVAHLGVVPVAGLTVRQVEALLAERLRSQGILKQPWVQVRVEQYRSRPVYVLGEVIQPGQYIITGKMFLLDLIGKAEGLSAKAHPRAYLYRLSGHVPATGPATSPADPAPAFTADSVLEIDMVALTRGERPELNVELRGGDVLYVREALPDYYYVVGDVGRPGTFALGSREPIRLSHAVARAGGPLRTAKMSQGLLVRSGPNGVIEQIRFDYKKVLKGLDRDTLLQPNDIVFIPGSQAKTLGYALLGVVPNVAVSTTASSVQ